MNFLDENGNDTRQFNHPCKNGCGRMINDKRLICDICKTEVARKQQELKYEGKNANVDFIRCKICGWPDSRLGPHIKTVHGYTKQQYKKEFNSKLNCPSITNKTAFHGPHTTSTKLQMAESHRGQAPWNTGLTKHDHKSLAAIAEKAAIRLSKLENNVWHTNPLSGERSGRFGKSSWCDRLNNETSEILAERSETASGIYHHRSNLTTNAMYNLNHSIRDFRHQQKEKVKQIDKVCIVCESTEIDAHHIIPEKCFDFYDITAHSGYNLVALCNNCHSSIAQQVDNSLLACNLNIDKMRVEYPVQFDILNRWLEYAEQRNLLIFPISKDIVQLLSDDDRNILAQYLFDYFRKSGFPLIQYDESALDKDFDNVKQSFIEHNEKTHELRCYNSTGSKIREHFIKEQYSRMIEVFNSDSHLMRVIRNRLGLDWKTDPEFFNVHEKTIITGFRVLYPQYSFTQYSCAVAKFIIDNFCQCQTVYDYAAGWGSRMIASAACSKNYLGIDTNKRLVSELKVLGDWLMKKSSVSISVACDDASKFDCGRIGFAYSCPPYGVQEKYSGMSYEHDEEWLRCYMRPVIDVCARNLVSGGRFVCHISSKLANIVRSELVSKLKPLVEYSFLNHYHVFKGGRERANEVIFVFEK